MELYIDVAKRTILVIASDKMMHGQPEFTLGVDCRGDHHGGNIRRRRSDVLCRLPISLPSSRALAWFRQTNCQNCAVWTGRAILSGLCCVYRADEQS
jgi:hypothetical protein